MKPLLTPLPAVGALCCTAAALLLTAAVAPPARAADNNDAAVTLRVSPERDYVLRRGPREVILEFEIKAKRPDDAKRTPVNVAVVLDHSGSMEGAKLEKARQAACVALDGLDSDDYFSLVIFDNETEVLLPPERVGSREHRDNLKERINRIRPGGGTAIYAGVQLGAKQVSRFLDKERVNRVVLLSDGLANVGPSSTSDLAKLGHDLRTDGLSVTTIGLGDDFNEDLMTALAESSHANYYYVRDSEKLPGIFREELGAAGTRVAGDIRIRIEAPAGVRLRGIIGHPEISCQERATDIALPELFGSEHRLYHLRCTLDDSPANDALPVAKVTLAYDDAATRKRQTQDSAATVKLTDDSRQSDDSVQTAVAQNYNVLQNRLDKEAAVALADAGKAKDAATLLRSRAAANAALPAQQQMPGARDENAKLEGLATELTANGQMGKASRKQAQYDNYKDKNQKK